MRVWTNGSFARIWVTDTIYRYRDGALRVEDTVKKVKGAQEDSADEVVAWNPKGERLDLALDKKRRKILDACALDAERVAAVISEGRSGPRLIVGPPDGPFDHDIALKGIETTRASWPAGIWERGREPWVDDEKPSGSERRGVRVHASRHGVAATAGATGHVAVLRPGAEELSFALRVPAQPEARLDAVPTREGVLLTLVADDGRAQVVHFAEDGAALGGWPDEPAEGCVPTLLLDDDKALAFDRGRGVLALLSLPDLTELTTEPLSEPLVDAATGPRGGTVLVADATHVYDVTIDDESISVDGPYLLREAKKASEDELDESQPGYEPALASGPAQIAFPAGKGQGKDPPWTLDLGKEGAIQMKLRSGAGPGRGVRIEISGNALEAGLVRPIRARVGSLSAELVDNGGSRVAVLPEVELVRGVAWPLDPKPTKDDEKEQAKQIVDSTHFRLHVELAGEAEGNGLLTIAVSACDSSSAALKRTRPITVT